MKHLWTFFLSALCLCAAAQSDTLIIKPGNINTKALKSGMHRWLVYFKNGVDSPRYNFQIWNRKIDFIDYDGRKAFAITQQWESNDTITHTVYSVSDATSFQPLYHDSWWKGRGHSIFDLLKGKGSVASHELSDADTSRIYKRVWEAFTSARQQYILNWHLDLETFPMLPYKASRTFGINFYEPGSLTPQIQYYTVAGSGKLEGFNGQQIDCWLLVHQSSNNKETFYISKKTKEVLKLEQEFNGRFRIKAKMSFAS